jgi:hypothetical protein
MQSVENMLAGSSWEIGPYINMNKNMYFDFIYVITVLQASPDGLGIV